MNIKERGVTVGDLVILIILIITTIYLAKYFNNDKRSNFKLDYQSPLIVKLS